MFIRSERLFLRPIWAEDWQDLHAGLSDEEVERNFLRMGWPYSPEELRNGAGLDPRLPHFMVTLPRGNHGVDVLGMIGMIQIDGQLHLGYWIARDYRGQGYATEAGRAVLSLARTLGHRHIVARHYLDNPASARVLRKLGFSPLAVDGARAEAGHGLPVLTSSMTYTVDLGVPSDCDDDLGGRPTRRAA
ncbi:GNAT family N-acetyltransferase [Novosphingobium rosa]|uniref:GNAT family N-acetyltransferase n=1 Tax=Novosphingobium rosa TaxID=76978 RepID=UPI0008335D4A|nr:GNAT family N-acetyltransferase [Novosphingobium rosa]